MAAREVATRKVATFFMCFAVPPLASLPLWRRFKGAFAGGTGTRLAGAAVAGRHLFCRDRSRRDDVKRCQREGSERKGV